MKPQELDRLIAHHIMNWNVIGFPLGRGIDNTKATKPPYIILVEDIPSYSTDMARAWEVVEVLTKDDKSIPLITRENDYNPTEWYVEFQGLDGFAHAPTGPLAICLAGLKARKVTIEKEKIK